MNDRITAPWTHEQVAALNAWQFNPWVHPFTCGECRDNLGTRFIRDGDGGLHRETDEEFATLLSLGAVELDPDHPLVARIVIVERKLVATTDGWICRSCDYTQEWAWDFMAARVAVENPRTNGLSWSGPLRAVFAENDDT